MIVRGAFSRSGEFDAETTNSLQLLKEAMERFGCLASIEQVLTDRGTRFLTPNKRDKNGNGDSRFENFLVNDKMKHIKSRVNHPQTNGKVEKWNTKTSK